MKITQNLFVLLLLLCATVTFAQEEKKPAPAPKTVEEVEPPRAGPAVEEEEIEFVDMAIEEEEEVEVEFVDAAVEEEVFLVVESMPRFPGCEDKANRKEQQECASLKAIQFVYRNIKYPPTARKNGTEGTAVVSFVVQPDGSLSGFEILRDPGDGCGAEAKRALETMPNWIPGKQRGKAVAVKMNYPVKFKLENGKVKNKRKRSRKRN